MAHSSPRCFDEAGYHIINILVRVWSIWLSVFWGSWWGASALFMLLPRFLRATVAAIIGGDRSWVDLARPLRRWFTLFAWSLVSWLSFINLVSKRADDGNSTDNATNLSLVTNLLFGLFLCSCVIAGEKVIIQFIAWNFHQQTYQDRMLNQQFQVKALVTLYTHSSDMGRSDTLKNSDASTMSKGSQMPRIFAKKALKGLRSAASNSANMLGNVASEMAGTSVLQPNSPQSMVTASLSSANKTRMLARRIYYSFRQGKQEVEIADIARHFPTLDIANQAFEVLDADGNGGATRDEIEMSLMEIHRERLSLASSMRDLDGAVSRLDNILMGVVLLICVLILTAMVTEKLTTLVTSAGTFLLGLSWLIGSTAQEVLGACIFLFVKHPMDVGDRVDIDTVAYVVLEMNLMSTCFRRVDGKWVFISNNILNTKVIENVRRSGATSETFSFDVAFDTSFEAIQRLREAMLAFVKRESRDFLPNFDIIVSDFPTQSSLNLKADIKYKTNWQQGALKVQRRNKWICALKDALAELKIYGPGGNGNPSPDPAGPAEYTLVPYTPPAPVAAPAPAAASPQSQHGQEDSSFDSPYGSETLHLGRGATAPAKPPTYDFVDRRNVIQDPGQDIFGEDEQDAAQTQPPTRTGTPALRSRSRRADEENQEVIEMNQRPRA
ncbi:Mechanosensitive ion channel-domain-containing protein [Mrakia frigida]|uniref:Mechanosensitive ion channel-domain-containing protein n=1 Tax=Mrakia frigida TaxID=29902 RepID=UPI003FCC24E4